MDAFSITTKKNELPERVMIKYLTSLGINIQQAVKDLNRKITVSPHLEMDCGSSGVVLEELRPLSLPSGEYSTDAWVGRCGQCVQTLTLFKIQFSDFLIPFKTEFKIFRPYLRHLTQNHTLFKTRMK